MGADLSVKGKALTCYTIHLNWRPRHGEAGDRGRGTSPTSLRLPAFQAESPYAATPSLRAAVSATSTRLRAGIKAAATAPAATTTPPTVTAGVSPRSTKGNHSHRSHN